MTIQFAPKTVTLVANTQNTINWGLSDFANTLGQNHGIIHDQISLSFQVVNNTPQVCYIGLSYTTITNSFNVSDRKSVAAVPANSSLNITPLTTPSLAIIGPDIVSIQMTLLSAGAGTVVVNMQADTAQPASASGGSLFGLDDRSISDYIIFSLGGKVTLGSGSSGGTTTNSYTIPAGKRGSVIGIYVVLPPIPQQEGQIEINIVNPTIYIPSSTLIPVVFQVDTIVNVVEAAGVISIAYTLNGLINQDYTFTRVLIIKEYF